MAPTKVLIDTCTLFSIRVTEVLLYAAERGLFAPRWSDRILAALERYVPMAREDVTPEDIARRCAQMNMAFPSAMVHGYEHLIGEMTNHEGDRHVLAAAVHADAEILVTNNLKHFPDRAVERYGIVVQHPDEFLVEHLEDYEADMLAAVDEAVMARCRPPETVGFYLDRLVEAGVPAFAYAVKELLRTY